MSSPSTLVMSAYVLANLAGMVAYVPQILCVWRSASARREVVLSMWWVWTLGGATELLYAMDTGQSVAWQVMAALHTLACALVAGLASVERGRGWEQRRRLPNALVQAHRGVNRPHEIFDVGQPHTPLQGQM